MNFTRHVTKRLFTCNAIASFLSIISTAPKEVDAVFNLKWWLIWFFFYSLIVLGSWETNPQLEILWKKQEYQLSLEVMDCWRYVVCWCWVLCLYIPGSARFCLFNGCSWLIREDLGGGGFLFGDSICLALQVLPNCNNIPHFTCLFSGHIHDVLVGLGVAINW